MSNQFAGFRGKMFWFADGGGKADVYFDRQLIDWSRNTVVQVSTGVMMDQVVDGG